MFVVRGQLLALLTIALFCGALPALAETPSPQVCVGVRGNGFRIPAHFGALARITEEGGFPDVMAAGSSGTLTMFLTDSVAMSPWLKGVDADPKLAGSLLMKSLPRFIDQLEYEPELQTIFNAIGDPKKLKEANDLLDGIGKKKGLSKILFVSWKLLTSSTARSLAKIRNSIYFKEPINPEFNAYGDETDRLEKLMNQEKDATEKARLKAVVEFRRKQAEAGKAAAARFEDQDNNTFFRPGILSYGGIAHILDRAASFYAGYNFFDPTEGDKLRAWVNRCAPPSAHKTFDELVLAEPSCGTEFDQIARRYYQTYRETLTSKMPRCLDRPDLLPTQCKRYRYEDSASGARIATHGFVAVAQGGSAKRYAEMLQQFQQTTDPHFVDSYAIAPEDFRFGYYSDPAVVAAVKERLASPFTDSSGRSMDFTQDFKSQRIIALGKRTWFEMIRSSAEEPGNAKLREDRDSDGNLIETFGGWAELNPGEYLKGLGCKTTIVLIAETKEHEYSAESLIRRILPGMDGFKEASDHDIAYGSSDTTSYWGRWLNPGNPHSSETFSLLRADAVYCALWGSVDLIHFGPNDENQTDYTHQGTAAMILNTGTDVGYDGHLFIPDDVPADAPIRSWGVPNLKREDISIEVTDPGKPARPKFLGCLPPALPNLAGANP